MISLLVGGPRVAPGIAVLEQPPPPDLLGVLGGDRSVLQGWSRLPSEVPTLPSPDDVGCRCSDRDGEDSHEEKQGIPRMIWNEVTLELLGTGREDGVNEPAPLRRSCWRGR